MAKSSATTPQVWGQKIVEAAEGNQALLEILTSITQAQKAQQIVSNTANKPVPSQARGAVSLEGTTYIVQITNPGAVSPTSNLQAAQQQTTASQYTNLQNVTAIFHQLRASTSPAFSINSNTQTYGGDKGSTQTYWELSGLGSGNWYFQVRSSFDGQNWNQWKNINGGNSVTANPSEVTVLKEENSVWAVFTLPGNELMAVGAGLVPDQGQFTLPANLYSSAMAAIAAPNGYTPVGGSCYGIAKCDVLVEQPAVGAGLTGPPDYPIAVEMSYHEEAGSRTWSGFASIFAIAFDPLGENPKFYSQGQTGWVVFTLPGGAKIAIGTGIGSDGDEIWIPPDLAWFQVNQVRSIVSPTNAVEYGHFPHGISVSALNPSGTGLKIACQYFDGVNIMPSGATWLAIAYQDPGALVGPGLGSFFVKIPLQNGQNLYFGSGIAHAGSDVTLPPGCSVDQMLSICSPASFDNPSGHHLEGIAQCEMVGLYPVTTYMDASFNQWPGDTNWFIFCWSNPV